MKKTFYAIIMVFVCSICVLLSGCGVTPNEYSISVYVNGANFGTVEDVSGEYLEGTEVTITAKPYSGQTFFCWLKDNKVVSGEEKYTLKINKETAGSYIALFKCADLEYISLSDFSFNNVVEGYNGDTEQILNELSLSFGYSQNELHSVYTCSDTEILAAQNIEFSNEIIYPEGEMPFAFDKTKDIYIKVLAKYTTILEETELNYISETILLLEKSTNLSADSVLNKIENKILNVTKNTVNENLPQLEPADTNSTISINFKKLSEFNFEMEEE